MWLCTALHGFTHAFQVALIPLYLKIQKDFALEKEGQVTFLVTAMSIAYFVPAYPMGVLADHISRKKLLGMGLLINALAYIGLSFAPDYSTAVACVLLAGFGGSFYHPSATALVAQLFPEATGKALGRVGIGASLGFFFAPFYAGWRAETAGWRQPVLELGILGLIGAAFFYSLAQEQKNQTTTISKIPTAKSKEKLFATPLLWFFFLAASLILCLRDFAGCGMASLGSLFLQHAHQFDARQTGLMISCIYVASAISNPLFGGLSDRGRIRWSGFVLVVAALAIVVFPRVSRNWVIPTLALYGFFFMASYPIIEALLMESVHDSVRGRVFGIFITLGGLLGNFAHWIVGIWVEHLGPNANSVSSYFHLYDLLAISIVVSLSALWFLHGIRRKEKTENVTALRPQAIPIMSDNSRSE